MYYGCIFWSLLVVRWSDVYNDPDPVVSLNDKLTSIIRRRVPTKIIKHRIKDKPWFNDDCINAFNDKQYAYRLWRQNRSQLLWDNYVILRRQAQLVYNNAQTEYNNLIRDSLSSATNSHKWWSTLKTFLFGVEHIFTAYSH